MATYLFDYNSSSSSEHNDFNYVTPIRNNTCKKNIDDVNEVIDPTTPISAANPTISDMILKLRSSFQMNEFDEIAAILESREHKLNQQITELKTEVETLGMYNTDLEKNRQKITLEKLQIEAQLKKYKAECKDLKEKGRLVTEDLARVRLDLKLLSDRENRARESFAEHIADLEKEKNEKNEKLVKENLKLRNDLEKEISKSKESLIKLKEDIVSLIVEKSIAEESARAWERKFQQYEPRVVKLEKDICMISRSGPVVANIVENQNVLLAQRLGANKSPDLNVDSVINGNLESVEAQKQSNLSNHDENTRASPGPVSNANLPKIDTNGSQKTVINGNSELAEPQKQSKLSNCDENAHALPGAGSTANSPVNDTNGSPVAGLNPSDVACANKMPIEIQEVFESRPCKNIMESSTAQFTGIGNTDVIEIDDSDDEMPIIGTSSASQITKDYGKNYLKDPASRLSFRGNRLFGCTQSNSHIDGDDASRQNRKRKMNSPFLSTISTEDNSDSSDDSTTDADMEKLVYVLKRKAFKFEADMLSAFSNDDEFCLNAVCALYRQDKFLKCPLDSKRRGFSPIDATRGYTLAKFLIDEDPQAKLRKSIEELQQYDPKGIDDCRRLAMNHVKQLFQIYQNKEDLFF